MAMNIHRNPSLRRTNPPLGRASWSRRATAASTDLEFGRFRVLLRRRQLLADGVPVELGTRAFDLLLALLEADGSLVTKEGLMSQVWPGVVVSEGNLKLQVSVLRKALGAERDLIQTEFGRGYRFIGVLHVNDTTVAPDCLERERLQSPRHPSLPRNRGRARVEPSQLSALVPGCRLGRIHWAGTVA